jgi:hypothetical protein
LGAVAPSKNRRCPGYGRMVGAMSAASGTSLDELPSPSGDGRLDSRVRLTGACGRGRWLPRAQAAFLGRVPPLPRPAHAPEGDRLMRSYVLFWDLSMPLLNQGCVSYGSRGALPSVSQSVLLTHSYGCASNFWGLPSRAKVRFAGAFLPPSTPLPGRPPLLATGRPASEDRGEGANSPSQIRHLRLEIDLRPPPEAGPGILTHALNQPLTNYLLC